MNFKSLALTLIAALTFAAPAFAAQSPANQKPYEPQVGQEGKDVIWVPTPQALVEKMLDMAKVTAKDVVIDLGSGDGRTVIAAAKRGARAMGIEYNPDMVELSQRAAAKEGVSARATFNKADIFESDYSSATVITMYLLPSLNMKLRPKILDLKPGTRIVSHAFSMEDWGADQTETVEHRSAYLWIVPAKVSGTWQLPQGELSLKQAFQMINGTLRSNSGGGTVSVTGRLNGDQITFSAGGTEYSGRVAGDVMEGTSKGGGAWKASRSNRAASIN